MTLQQIIDGLKNPDSFRSASNEAFTQLRRYHNWEIDSDWWFYRADSTREGWQMLLRVLEQMVKGKSKGCGDE